LTTKKGKWKQQTNSCGWCPKILILIQKIMSCL
jgi:hypothetical protein